MNNIPEHSALVTGGKGFIGSHLTRRLVESQVSVIVLDDGSGPHNYLGKLARHPKITLVEQSAGHEVLVDQLVSTVDMVFHFAGPVGVRKILGLKKNEIEQARKANSAIIQACVAHQKPLFAASTSEIYGEALLLKKRFDEGLTETDSSWFRSPDHPRWSYARMKLDLENELAEAAREHGLMYIAGRFFNVTGSNHHPDSGMILPTLVYQALSKGRMDVFGSGDQIRSFCHISDAIEAIVRLMNARISQEIGNGMFNIGKNEPITLNALAELIALSSPQSVDIHHIEYPEGYHEIPARIPNLSKIEETIQFNAELDVKNIVRSSIVYHAQILSK